MGTEPIYAEDFVPGLVAKIPSLESIYREHLSENEVLLSHVFFGDLTRLVMHLCENDPSSDLPQILDALECGMTTGDRAVQELIAVSFLENLDPTSKSYPVLRGMLGPRLLEELRRHE